MPSDRFGKRPKEPRLLKAVTVNAFLNHDFDNIIELVPSHEPLHILIEHVVCLWGAGITGPFSHSKVQLPAVISRWGLASLVLSLLVGKVVTYSFWSNPWHRFVVPVYARGRGRDREALISKECGGVGRWNRAPLVLSLGVEKVFAPSRWRKPWS